MWWTGCWPGTTRWRLPICARVHQEYGDLATDLWDMEFPPIKYAVPVYLAEGLTLFAGAPKRGKSWLALDLCVAVARGGYTLGDQHCIEGDVLYAALEDNRRRMRSRLKTVCQLAGHPPHRLRVWYDLPRLGCGGEERLREWLDSHKGARLIVIDTLAYIPPDHARDEDPSPYAYRSASTLQRIASEYRIAILLIHHTRKMAADDYLESVSGTNGLTGGSDAVMVLAREADGTTILKGRGRDIEEFEIAVKFDKGSCRWARKFDDPADVRRSAERRAILQVLRDTPEPLMPKEIALQTQQKANTVSYHLAQMLKVGVVEKAEKYGKYQLPLDPPQSPRSPHDGG